MQNFNLYNPVNVLFGPGESKKIGESAKKLGNKALLVTYENPTFFAQLLQDVRASLTQSGVSYIEFFHIQANPLLSEIKQAIAVCREQDVELCIGIGGGSVMDATKAIAAGAVYDGDFWDYYEGKLVEEALPIGTVITISAAGSEGSPDSVITKEEGMFKRGATGEAFRPKFTIMNPALTQTLPAYQTACGITDIMAHLYERYLTNTEEVEVTDRMIEGLLLTMIHEGPRVIADPDNYQARANIMWAGMMAHNNSCGVGRTQDWTSHNIEHELSALYDCAHGAGLAVVMPAVFTYTLEHNVMRFAQAAVRVWGCQMDFADPKRTALEGIEALRNFLISIGMPKNFAELGAKEEDIEKLAHTCCYGDVNTGTVEGFATLDQKDVENIYKLMVF